MSTVGFVASSHCVNARKHKFDSHTSQCHGHLVEHTHGAAKEKVRIGCSHIDQKRTSYFTGLFLACYKLTNSTQISVRLALKVAWAARLWRFSSWTTTMACTISTCWVSTRLFLLVSSFLVLVEELGCSIPVAQWGRQTQTSWSCWSREKEVSPTKVSWDWWSTIASFFLESDEIGSRFDFVRRWIGVAARCVSFVRVYWTASRLGKVWCMQSLDGYTKLLTTRFHFGFLCHMDRKCALFASQVGMIATIIGRNQSAAITMHAIDSSCVTTLQFCLLQGDRALWSTKEDCSLWREKRNATHNILHTTDSSCITLLCSSVLKQ